MIHIGTKATGETLCGKPVARRWWQEAAHIETGHGPGRLTTWRRVKPDAADCRSCLRVARAAQT